MDQLKGQLIKITYEGLPLEFEEWDDLYIEGEIPLGIWDEIRTKHEEHMRDPDWMVEELTEITIKALEAAGCKVYTFSGSGEFPALRNVLCNWCCCQMAGSYHETHFREAVFCTESCLFEALTQSGEGDGEIHIKNSVDKPNAEEMLECPHCHKLAIISEWNLEGEYTVPGPEGFTFKAGTCPTCGKNAPLIVAVMIDANDPRLLEDSSNAEERQRMEEDSPQGRYNPPADPQVMPLAISVLSKFDIEGWKSTWEVQPGHFEVHQAKGDYFFAGTVCDYEDGKQVNLIRIHLRDDTGLFYQGWAIPFKPPITADAVIKAFKDCIEIFETEEIEGVDH